MTVRSKPKRGSHHLDGNRATQLLKFDDPRDDDDELLTTPVLAEYLCVSEQWLTIGRHRGYGPSYIKVDNNRVMYRRRDIRAWLKSRTFSSVAEFKKAVGR